MAKPSSRQELIDLEFERQKKVIELKEAQIIREFKEQLRVIQQKDDALTRELVQNAKQISDRRMIALREEELLRAQQEIERVKQQQVIDNLKAEKDALTLEEAVLTEEKKLAELQDNLANKQAMARIDALDFQADIVNGFIGALNKDTKFVKAIEAFVGAVRAPAIAKATDAEEIAKRTEKLRTDQTRINELRGSVREQRFGTRQKRYRIS